MNDKDAVTALKQVWRKDAPIVFEVPQRITNSSMSNKPEHSYTGNRMQSARGEAAERAVGIRSVGLGC